MTQELTGYEVLEIVEKMERNAAGFYRRAATSRPQAPTAVFGDRADPSKELTGRETKADVLRMAIQREKDAIAYYTSLKEFVPGDDVEAIKDILSEEDRHVRILTQSLEQIT